MRHICHVSVLNPLKHSRIYYRWGLGALKLGYRVSIVAQHNLKGIGQTEDEKIQLIGTGKFSRLSFSRLFFSFFQRKKILAAGADIFVLHSPELLGLGRWLKKKTEAKIIYDAHEDYYKNIIHARHYPSFLRKPLAQWVRKREEKALDYLDAVVYAEDCYEGMLPVENGKFFILRNKFAVDGSKMLRPDRSIEEPYMLSTGTLAWEWGIRESLELWKKACEVQPLRWVVAGHSQDKSLLEYLQREAEKAGLAAYLTIIGGVSYVPYETILRLIRHCLFGTAFYHLQPNIKGKIPTKFYEFMSLGRPLLFTQESCWDELNGRIPFGFSVKMGAWEEEGWVKNILDNAATWESDEESRRKGHFESEIPVLKSLLERLYH